MSSNQCYEFVFEVAHLSEHRLEQVERFYDCVVATHGRATTLSTLVPGVDGVTAAREVLTVVISAGITVERLVDDLVTRAEIATRVGVTPQAVGLWVRGERNRVARFPDPYVYAAGATLWLWGDVVEFLREIGATVDGSAHYPSRQETLQIAGLILEASAGRRVAAAG